MLRQQDRLRRKSCSRFYLAKKLNLTYMKCRYYLAMALLELVIPEGKMKKAEECFSYAERLTDGVPYTEVLWQVQYYAGKLCEWNGRMEQSEMYYAKSLAGRRTAADKIPLTFRQGYLKSAADEELETLLDQHMSRKLVASQGG